MRRKVWIFREKCGIVVVTKVTIRNDLGIERRMPMKITTGHLAEKSGKWYAVINLYDADGKRHEKWRSLGLDAKKGTKTEANHRLNEVLEQYNLGDQYLHEGMSRADKERNRITDM